MESLEKDSV